MILLHEIGSTGHPIFSGTVTTTNNNITKNCGTLKMYPRYPTVHLSVLADDQQTRVRCHASELLFTKQSRVGHTKFNKAKR